MPEQQIVKVPIPPGFEQIDLEIHATADGRISLKFASKHVTVIGAMETEEAEQMATRLGMAIVEARSARRQEGGRR